jgi:hypothetical protein
MAVSAADGTTKVTDSDIRKIVETANAEDENQVDGAEGDEADDDDTDENDDDDAEGESGDESTEDADDEEESTDEDEESEDEDDESDESDKTDKSKKPNSSDKKSKSTFRYSQYAGDGSIESYTANLEKAYENSSAEAIRLNQSEKQATRRVDAILRAAANDSELAEKLNGVLQNDVSSDGATTTAVNAAEDPFLVNARSQWKANSEKEATDFIKANPEVVSDPKIKAEVLEWMEEFSRIEFEKNGRLMTAGEAMRKAYKHLDLEDKSEKSPKKSSKSELASAAKSIAAPTRPHGGSKKLKTSKTFTESQVGFAQLMGKDASYLAKYAK